MLNGWQIGHTEAQLSEIMGDSIVLCPNSHPNEDTVEKTRSPQD